MPDWRPTPRSDAFDVGLAVGLGGLAVVSLAIGGDPEVSSESMADYARPGGELLVAAAIAPIAVRRRFPLAALVVVTGSLSWMRIIEVPEYSASALALFVALYSASAYGGRRRRPVQVVCGVGLAVLLTWDIARMADDVPDGRFVLLATFAVAINVFQLGAVLALGEVIRSRRARERELERQAEALRHASEVEARQAVLAERMRIARELHDVLAHHVSVMGVQAAAARRVLGSRPESVPGLLETIEASSRDAVGELQRLLGLLRTDGDDGGAEPQPTLARLDDLAEQVRDAGVAVAVDLDGVAVDDIPPAIGLSAYRIVQEALTNTLKHAGPGASADVKVRRSAASLELSVVDDGRSTPPGETTNGTGHGLIGMRERVRLHGGELKFGRAAAGGFEVRAWFPL